MSTAFKDKRVAALTAAIVLAVCGLVLIFGSSPQAAQSRGPLQPSEELQTFALADSELIVELVAAEPDVVSPVAAAWDEEGRMYVVEMRDYPLGPGQGQVILLTDSDGDGRYQKQSVFADKLPFPTSVLPWNGGVLVTAAPDIWFLKDTDGDGKADQRRVVLTGFSEGNQQLRANGLMWGLDNWVYGANGRSDGELRNPDDKANKVVSIRRRDFRLQPATGQFEAVAGFSQFGLARDDWGNRFLSWNTTPLRQVVIEERHLSRTPSLHGSSVAQVADPEDSGRLFRLSPPSRTFNGESLDFPNASCGVTVYRGDLLGEAYHGNAFVCEPLLNLVHRRILVPNGPAFDGKRGERDKEFLASTDPWFHPVNITTGPDGALYVVDFYREMVEHPQYAGGSRDSVDFRVGHNHGRIWRIRHKESKLGPSPRLSSQSAAELAALLNHPVGWWRDTAQRLLVERKDAAAIPHLAEVVARGDRPEGRVHALWTLHGLNALKDEWLAAALADPHPRVREHAVRLCEGRLERATALKKVALKLADDDDTRVRFQLAIVLGEVADTSATESLAAIAQRDVSNEWVQLAILSSLGNDAWPFAETLLKGNPQWLQQPTAEQSQFLDRLGELIGTQIQPKSLAAALEFATRQDSKASPGRLALLAGLGDGLSRSRRPLRSLVSQPPAEIKPSLAAVDRTFQLARRLSASASEPESVRVLAVRVLAHGKPTMEGQHLLRALEPGCPLSVQAAAARGLADLDDAKTAAQALQRWTAYPVPTRREIITALAGSPRLVATLLDSILAGTVSPREIDTATQQALLNYQDPGLHKKAESALDGGQSGDRRQVVQDYASAAEQASDAARGGKLFVEHCSNCHQLQGQGHRVGPDLSGIANRSRSALLSDILDPSHEVAPDFVNYVLRTDEGQVLVGLLAAETATSVSILRPAGIEDVISRDEVEELRATRKSLMPEGFERVLNPRDMADLLTFLQQPALAGKRN